MLPPTSSRARVSAATIPGFGEGEGGFGELPGEFPGLGDLPGIESLLQEDGEGLQGFGPAFDTTELDEINAGFGTGGSSFDDIGSDLDIDGDDNK